MKSLLLMSLLLTSFTVPNVFADDCSVGVRVDVSGKPHLAYGSHYLSGFLSRKAKQEVKKVIAEVAAASGVTVSTNEQALSFLLFVDVKGSKAMTSVGNSSQFQEKGFKGADYLDAVRQAVADQLRWCNKQ